MQRAIADLLDEFEQRMVDHLAAAANTLSAVAVAVVDPNPRRAATITLDAETLRERAHHLHVDLIVRIAQHAPVAADLRLVMGLIDVAHHTALIANQFELIGEQLWVTDVRAIDRLAAGDTLSRMCVLASRQIQNAATAFHTRDLVAVEQLDRDDDAIDRLNRQIFEAAALTELSADERALAFRHVLIARCLERIADNAVDVGEQAMFVMTAEMRELSDASQPRRRRH